MMLTFALPTLIVCLPIAGYITTYLLLSKPKRTVKRVVVTGLIMMLIGMLTPWIAALISIGGVASELASADIRCGTPLAVFFMFWLFTGYIVTFSGIPLTGLILYWISKKHRQ